MHLVRHNWQRPTLLDFNNWLKENSKGHEELRVLNSKVVNLLNQAVSELPPNLNAYC